MLTKKMSVLLKLEEIGEFALSIYLFTTFSEYSWWLYPACFFLPDFSMIGYAINPSIGAKIYNFFHHKLLAILFMLIGFIYNIEIVLFSGIILFGHSAFDRVLGYGLKYENDFTNTHLGSIGKGK